MKSAIGNSTRPREGLLIACLTLWLEEFDLPALIEEVLEADGIGCVPSFHDHAVGGALVAKYDVVGEFLLWTEDHPDVKKIMTIVGNNPSWVKYSVDVLLSVDVGKIVKTTKWWASNVDRLEKLKKDKKTVEKVMES